MTEDEELRANTLLQILMQSAEILSNPSKYNRQAGAEEVERIKGLMDYCYSELAILAEDEATAPPVNRDVPQVMGNGTVGSTLTCTKGNWDNMGGEGQVSGTYAYAWQSDGSPNSATGETYNVVPGDVGKSITCIVTATNSLGSVDAPPSNAVAVA